MTERLTGDDAMFVYAETPEARFEIASCVVVDPTAAVTPFSFEAARRAVAERLHLLPRLRQRLVRVPLELDRPVWVDDPDVDLDRHIRRHALPQPGGRAELERLLGDLLTRPLDRTRPLWELHLVEGLEGGRAAGVVRTHHAMVDGVAGVQLLSTLLDDRPDAVPPPPHRRAAPRRAPSQVELAVRALPAAARQPVRSGRAVATLAAGALRRRVASATPRTPTVDPDEGRRVGRADAPPTPFNAAVGRDRAVALVDLPFEDVRRIADGAGCTVNDVVVATVGGAVRAHLQRAGQLPDEPLVAFVPVSTRGRGEGDAGNRTSLMYASMGTDLDDPRARLEAVAASTRRGKAGHRREGPPPTDLTEVAGPFGAALAGRVLAATGANRHLRLGGNVVVSNIPGPDRELWFAGAPVERLYPFGPLVDGNALNVTVLSFRRRHLSFGLVADPAAVPGLDRLGRDLAAAFAGLQAAVVAG